jgi:hypothetical protein
VRKDAESVPKPAETERNEATLADTPRACLFREAKPALLALGISDSRTGSLIVQWLKLTNETDQLVLAFLGSRRGRGASVPRFAYSYKTVRCWMTMNVPSPTKAVRPIENRILTSSACLVSR